MFYSSTQLQALRGVSGNTFKKRLQYQLKHNKLTKLRKWLYGVPEQLPFATAEHRKQAGNLVYVPSYISCETVLQEAGCIFQYNEALTLMWPYTKEIFLEQYHRMRQRKRLPHELLVNPLWLLHTKTYTQASPERALCDLLRYNSAFTLDSILPLQASYAIEIATLYAHYKPTILVRVLSLLGRSHD